MIDLVAVFMIVWLHFVADFICQTSYMAANKSKSNMVLLLHVVVYMLPFVLFGAFFGIAFILINGVLHGIVDYHTSRITSKLWQNDDKHWFFVVVGADQAIHLTCLMLSYIWIVQ